jgi:hypothetical protein
MKNGVAAGILVLACVVVWPVGAQQAPPTPKTHKTPQTHHAHKRHHARHARARAHATAKPLVNQGPMPPPEPEVAAAPEVVAPVVPAVVVTYFEGELGITAQDAELREVLEKVREATGAVVEAPSMEQRVTVRVNPEAPARAVAALVDGLRIDYAVSGGTGAGDPVRRIILMPRPAKTALANTVVNDFSERPNGDAGDGVRPAGARERLNRN